MARNPKDGDSGGGPRKTPPPWDRKQKPETQLTVAQPADEPIPLTPEQDALLQKLLDEAELVRNESEALVRKFGRFVLREVFKGRSAEARAADTSTNPVWRELNRRAGGPTLRLSARFISLSTRLVGFEQAINDEVFRGMDFERKALLLPLGDVDVIREAAQHVVAMKLDQDATEAYVASLRARRNKPALSRMTPARARTHLQSFTRRFTDKRALPKLVAEFEALEPARRRALLADAEDALQVVTRLRNALRGK